MYLYYILLCLGEISYEEKEVEVEIKNKQNEANILKQKINKIDQKKFEKKIQKFINIDDFKESIMKI